MCVCAFFCRIGSDRIECERATFGLRFHSSQVNYTTEWVSHECVGPQYIVCVFQDLLCVPFCFYYDKCMASNTRKWFFFAAAKKKKWMEKHHHFSPFKANINSMPPRFSVFHQRFRYTKSGQSRIGILCADAGWRKKKKKKTKNVFGLAFGGAWGKCLCVRTSEWFS